MAVTYQFGGLPPTFIGPDIGTLTIKQTDTGQVALGPLFTLAEGPPTFSNQGAAPTGVTLNTATGVYSWAGGMTPGTYAMVTRVLGIDNAPSYLDYAWTLVINSSGTVAVPVFTGPINDQTFSANGTFDTSVFATGQTSYSETGALPAGITFLNGVYTINVALTGNGLFGPFVTNYINAGGTISSNAFAITVNVTTGGGGAVVASEQETIGRGVGRGILSGV